eukprot:SAG11_NODE_3793_length_2222_cov_1.888366_1_plen_93_part_10
MCVSQLVTVGPSFVLAASEDNARCASIARRISTAAAFRASFVTQFGRDDREAVATGGGEPANRVPLALERQRPVPERRGGAPRTTVRWHTIRT